nr:MAG: ORF1 [TTV-like mini virus]
MPPYWRRYRRYHTYKRRRSWFPRRRTRKTFRRRNRAKWRRRYKVKRRRFPKKKTKLIVKQFQPKTINMCKIIGYKCLFQGNILRANTNYIQYIYSYVPEHWPGGGGWSIMIFSLSSLFEDWQHLQNIWTKTNLGLPLVRYLGCQMKFYQSEDTDYIVVYDNCWPMVDTIDTHADSCPSRMLQRKNKITIPSRNTQKRKKPYKKVWIKPPTQMLNRWYFQKDLCNTPLLMLTATAIDLTHPFCSPKAHSNNITVTCLSPYQFTNPNFQHLPTSGYSPKETSTGTKLYFYASIHDHITNFNNKSEIQTLIPLLDTKNYVKGREISNKTSGNLLSTYGNPFMPEYLHGEEYTIYLTEVTPQTLDEKLTQTTYQPPTQSITKVTGPFLYQCRYNPERDTGAKNKAYLVNNGTATKWEPPENKNLYIEGYPLYILLWSFTDWVIKAKQTTNLNQNQILVIETDQFEEKLNKYIVLDQDFIDGFDPYTPPEKHTNHQPNMYNQKNWFPKYNFQQQSIHTICMSGPACPRSTWNSYLQAFTKYKFYFKWGGCPKQTPKAYDPCSQSKWPTPDNFNGRLEIQNPNRPPQTELYNWDWDEDYVKEPAIERIKSYTFTDEKPLLSTANKNNPSAVKIVQETQKTEKEEEADLFLQLQHLRKQRLLLELQSKLQLTKYL